MKTLPVLCCGPGTAPLDPEASETLAARFHALWRNDDARKSSLGRHVLEGRDVWLEDGIVGLGRSADEIAPRLPAAAPERASEERRRDALA